MLVDGRVDLKGAGPRTIQVDSFPAIVPGFTVVGWVHFGRNQTGREYAVRLEMVDESRSHLVASVDFPLRHDIPPGYPAGDIVTPFAHQFPAVRVPAAAAF